MPPRYRFQPEGSRKFADATATLPDGLSQGQYMQICLPMVAVSDELVMLPGWEQSEGAYIEFLLAKKSGKTIRELGWRILHQGEGNE